MEKSAVEALEFDSIYPDEREKLGQCESSSIFSCEVQVTTGLFVGDL